jgi:hypothetical protein
VFVRPLPVRKSAAKFQTGIFSVRARAVETANETKEALPQPAIIWALCAVYAYRQRRGPELEKRAAVLRRRAKKTRRGKPSPRIMMQERDEKLSLQIVPHQAETSHRSAEQHHRGTIVGDSLRAFVLYEVGARRQSQRAGNERHRKEVFYCFHILGLILLIFELHCGDSSSLAVRRLEGKLHVGELVRTVS